MEPVETINQRLADTFGIETDSNLPIWRIVWSEDQTEKRQSDYTETGVFLLTPRILEFKKYPYIKERFILERLVLVPEFQQKELCGVKKSYEPLFTFENRKGEFLPPKWEVCEIVIDSVLAVQGKSSLAKYLDNPDPERADEIKGIYEELFGNETDVTDALAYKEGVTVPSNYTKGAE